MTPEDSVIEHERTKYEKVWRNRSYGRHSPAAIAYNELQLKVNFSRQDVQTILDVGCGSGKVHPQLVKDGFTVTAVDLAANCLFPENKEFSDFHVGSAHDFQFMSALGAHDAVICVDVMEHIPPEYVLGTLYNLITVTNKMLVIGVYTAPDVSGPKLVGEPLHLTVQPAEWWKKMVSSAASSSRRTSEIISRPSRVRHREYIIARMSDE